MKHVPVKKPLKPESLNTYHVKIGAVTQVVSAACENDARNNVHADETAIVTFIASGAAPVHTGITAPEGEHRDRDDVYPNWWTGG